MKKFKAAIFDMDGTLLDSMYIWRHIALRYIEKNNIPLPEDMKGEMAIMGIGSVADFLIEKFHINMTREEMLAELWVIMEDYYRTEAVLKPGAADMLKQLRERNIPTLLFSATPDHILHPVLTRLDIKKYFSHGLLSCATIKQTKHEPEAFMTAARHLGVPYQDVMIFEDAWYAASTAKKAGFTLGIVADREEHKTEEMRALADFYIEKSWDEFPIDRYF